VPGDWQRSLREGGSGTALSRVQAALAGALVSLARAVLGGGAAGRPAVTHAGEARYREVLDCMTEGFQVIDREWRYVYLNDAAAMHAQTAKERLVGRSMMECYPGIEKTEVFELMRRCMEARLPQSTDNEFTYPDGSKRWFALKIQPAPEGVSVLSMDLTERRRAEEKQAKAEEALHRSQKLEAIGRLAGGVAHDFNNVLGVITGYGELARKEIPEGHPSRPRLENMLKAAERAAGLTRQLLAFSRKQIQQPRRLDLNAVAADLQSMFERILGEDIEIEIRSAKDLGLVNADPTQIEQVLLNLIVNARDAMPKGGCLTIETANVEFDDKYATAHPPALPGRFVMLAISDSGTGMDAETQQRAFEPFFTTKPRGEGTGLGLSTVYGIVKQSGGYVWLYSEPGRGTTFRVYIPRVDEASRGRDAAAPPPPSPAPRGEETLLLVEDSEALRDLIREVLEQHGYRVLQANHGERALEVLREHEGAVDLLLTDVVMPKLGGKDLADEVQVLHPGIRVLYMSGYTDGAISRAGILREGMTLLEKPFTSERLTRAVREALDRPEPGT
jgi:PAS domain S-box-containing protein